jgi:hypothetical protein
MPRPAGAGHFDFADVVRAHRGALGASRRLSREQRRVLTDIAQCRTAALGGHVDHCAGCGHEHPSYNSCRNRHCPKCQALTQEHWVEGRAARLVDDRHFHIVFTVPAELRPLARFRPRAFFDAMFVAAGRTLVEFGERRFRARIGATLVLHTWTRELLFHPHIHAIVTGGGMALDGAAWHRRRRSFLFPVKPLAMVFRGKLLAELSGAHRRGELAGFDHFLDPQAFAQLVRALGKRAWVVYAKPSFGTAPHVLQYLGRYTHRVGLANSRLLDVTHDRVVLRTRADRTVELHPVELLRRFVAHVLPDGLHKIRHVGLYASACARLLAVARAGLTTAPDPPSRSRREILARCLGRDPDRCALCGGSLTKLPLARAPPRGRAA